MTPAVATAKERVLTALYAMDPVPIGAREVQRYTGVKLAGVTRILAGLEGSGMVIRTRNRYAINRLGRGHLTRLQRNRQP